MSTKITRTKKQNTKVVKNKIAKSTARMILNDSDFKNVLITEIDFSPLNYRKFYSETVLADFAAELALHGIISALTVRPMPSGRYELVAGERRLRAAKIAGLREVPAIIKSLNDEEVTEIQLAENLQREDPHPMHEAYAIGQMQKTGKDFPEIAARLGKSKTFVYSRLKLLHLSDAFQEMFLANKINMQQAFEIATLSKESQQEYFDGYCSSWKEQKNFEAGDLEYILRKFRYDLKQAPFNTKDKKLVDGVGACTNCPSNTATLKSLFPEFARQAVCTNKTCYQHKCTAHFSIQFMSAYIEINPSALLFNEKPSPIIENAIQQIPTAVDLPKYQYHNVTVFSEPEAPDREDYLYENESDEEGEPEFDRSEFDRAMEEYKNELEDFNLMAANRKAIKGMFVSEGGMHPVLFSLEPPRANNVRSNTTAKEVEVAIKSGTATPELLQSEIDRLTSREARSKQLDKEKVQLKIHETFSEFVDNEKNSVAMTEADSVAVRLVIYNSLNYSVKSKVTDALFGEDYNRHMTDNETRFDLFKKMTDEQFGWLIRKAIIGHSDSKSPGCEEGYFLHRMAADIGIDITAIEKEQQQKANARQARMKEKIELLQMKITKMKEKV